MRLIDADALIKWLDNYYDSEKFTVGHICNMVKDVPTIEERKKGKWVSTDDGWDGEYFVCSACGCPWTLIEGSPEDNGMNFCPNCGAKMEETE